MSPEIQREQQKGVEQEVSIDDLMQQDAHLLTQLQETLGRCDALLQTVDNNDNTTKVWRENIAVLKLKFTKFSERKTTVLPSKIEKALSIWKLREQEIRNEVAKNPEVDTLPIQTQEKAEKPQAELLKVEKLPNGGFRVNIPESDSITIHHDAHPTTVNATTQFSLEKNSSGYQHYFVGNIERRGNTVTIRPHASYTGSLSMTHNGRNVDLRTLEPISTPKKQEPAVEKVRQTVTVQEKMPGQYEIRTPKPGAISLHYDQFGKSHQHSLQPAFSAYRNQQVADLERTSETTYILKVRPEYKGTLRFSFGNENIDVRQFETYAFTNLNKTREATDALLQDVNTRSQESIQRPELDSLRQCKVDILSAKKSISAEKTLLSQALQNNSTLTTEQRESITQRLEALDKQNILLDEPLAQITPLVEDLQKQAERIVVQNQIRSRFEGISAAILDDSNGANMFNLLSDADELSNRIQLYEQSVSDEQSTIQINQIATFTPDLATIKEQLDTLRIKAEARLANSVEDSYNNIVEDLAEVRSPGEHTLDYNQTQAELATLERLESQLTSITNESAAIIQNSNGVVSDEMIATILALEAKYGDLQPEITNRKGVLTAELTKHKEYIRSLQEKYKEQTTDQLVKQYTSLKTSPEKQQEYEAVTSILKERRNAQFTEGTLVYVVLPKQEGLQTDQQVIEQGTMYFDRTTKNWFVRNTAEDWSVAFTDIETDQKTGQRLVWLPQELEDSKNTTGKTWSIETPEVLPESMQSKFIQRKFEYLEAHSKMSYDQYQQLFGGEFQQQNVGNCYMIAALRALPKDHLQVMLRTSVQKLPNGSYAVSLPVGTQPPTTIITVLPSDLQAQNTTKNGASISMRPVNGGRGWQVLEAAYTLHLLEKQQERYRKDEDYYAKMIQEHSTPSSESKEKINDYRKSLLDVQQRVAENTPRDSRGQLNRKASEGGWGEYSLQTFIENDSDDRMSIYGYPNISTDSKAVQKASVLLDNFHNGRDSMVTTSTAHKDGDSRTYSIDGKSFYHQHQYLVQSVDKQRQQVTVVNPHDTSKPFTLTYTQFMRAFDSVNMHSIDYNKLFSTKQSQ